MLLVGAGTTLCVVATEVVVKALLGIDPDIFADHLDGQKLAVRELGGGFSLFRPSGSNRLKQTNNSLKLCDPFQGLRTFLLRVAPSSDLS